MKFQSVQSGLFYIPSQMWSRIKGLNNAEKKTAMIAAAFLGLCLLAVIIIPRLQKWKWNKPTDTPPPSNSPSQSPSNSPRPPSEATQAAPQNKLLSPQEQLNDPKFRKQYFSFESGFRYYDGTFDKALATGILQIVNDFPNIKFYFMGLAATRGDPLTQFLDLLGKENEKTSSEKKTWCLVMHNSYSTDMVVKDSGKCVDAKGNKYFKLILCYSYLEIRKMTCPHFSMNDDEIITSDEIKLRNNRPAFESFRRALYAEANKSD